MRLERLKPEGPGPDRGPYEAWTARYNENLQSKTGTRTTVKFTDTFPDEYMVTLRIAYYTALARNASRGKNKRKTVIYRLRLTRL